jgi:uncharacterized membrane protein YozB (DUF420 family)
MLPHLNAFLNFISAICLIAGFIFIKKRNVHAHRACMLTAISCSVAFLVSYLIYHFVFAGRTVFKDPLWFRPYYLTILLTHTVLAVVIVPMIIITASRALRARFDAHRRIARWTWPLWIYVSVTGVLIYFILYHLYPQAR